jgi:hypothetical protein
MNVGNLRKNALQYFDCSMEIEDIIKLQVALKITKNYSFWNSFIPTKASIDF